MWEFMTLGGFINLVIMGALPIYLVWAVWKIAQAAERLAAAMEKIAKSTSDLALDVARLLGRPPR